MSYVPALGFHWATPLYQTIVDLFVRDDYIKSVAVDLIDGRDLQILDVACGTGKLVKKIAQKQPCCQIVGCDIDSEMIVEAKKQTTSFPNVIIQQGNCTDMRFEDGKFDIVIESLVFHHLTDAQKKAAINEIHRVLQQNGLFYYIDWVKPGNLYAKIAFNIVKIVDGWENLESHENNTVINLIEESMDMIGTPRTIETTLGTIAVITFKKK